jgi:hypothetical protein
MHLMLMERQLKYHLQWHVMEEWLAVIADTSKWSSQTHNQTGSLYKDQKEQ